MTLESNSFFYFTPEETVFQSMYYLQGHADGEQRSQTMIQISDAIAVKPSLTFLDVDFMTVGKCIIS